MEAEVRTMIEQNLGMETDDAPRRGDIQEQPKEVPENQEEVKEEGKEEEVKQEEQKQEEPEDKTDWKTRYKNLEKLHGRHAYELGQLKAQITQLTSKPKEPEKTLDLDEFVKDPSAAIRAELERRQTEERMVQEQENQKAQLNVNYVYGVIPNMDELVETILEVAKSDGIATPSVEMIHNSIRTEPAVAIQYARRAQERLKYQGKVNNTKKVLNNASNATKNGPPVGAGGQPTTTRPLSTNDLKQMSNKDLELLLKNAGYSRKR